MFKIDSGNSSKNIGGIDYGTKYIGVSYRNERSNMISPVGSLSNDESLFFNIGDLLQRYHIGKLVIGYPKQNEELQKSIDGFIEQVLFIDRDIEIIKQDEEYTSVEAGETTGNFEKNSAEDTVASMKILERYMNKK